MIKLSDFEAVIFDMDGVLIDSEPIWKIAMESVFKSVGCPLTKADFAKTVGLRIDEVTEYWYSVCPWGKFSPQEVEKMIVAKMVELLSNNGKPLLGVIETLQFLNSNKLKIGLATSSYEVLIETVLATLNIGQYFDFTHSAEREDYGKPHPSVYLTCAQNLAVSPLKCLVIEDSLNGIISGKSARMKVVCIPEKSHQIDPKLSLADYQFDTMMDFLNAIKN